MRSVIPKSFDAKCSIWWSPPPRPLIALLGLEADDHDLHNRAVVASAIGRWNLASAIFAGILWKGFGAERRHLPGERGPTPSQPLRVVGSQ